MAEIQFERRGTPLWKVLPQFKGRVEGSVINRIAREVLAARAG